jgi:hypothetical protein
MINISDKICSEEKHILESTNVSPKPCHLWDDVKKYLGARQASDEDIRRMRFASWIAKDTNVRLEYVTFIAFPRQQLLRERSLMLHLHIAYIISHIISVFTLISSPNRYDQLSDPLSLGVNGTMPDLTIDFHLERLNVRSNVGFCLMELVNITKALSGGIWLSGRDCTCQTARARALFSSTFCKTSVTKKKFSCLRECRITADWFYHYTKIRVIRKPLYLYVWILSGHGSL